MEAACKHVARLVTNVEPSPVRILWLYGPPAVGKSVTAWELLNLASERDTAIGYVDIDQLGMTYYDGDNVDPERHQLKGRALAAVAREFEASGARVLLVSGVIGPELMDFYTSELERFAPVFVRLTAPDDELRRRLTARGVYAEDWADVEASARAVEAAGLEHTIIDTRATTPAYAATLVLPVVLQLLSDYRPLPVNTAPDDSERHADQRAVLIGGTTAVGKSTIGWRAFIAAQEDGRRTSFVDLRQLGFMGRSGGAVDHGLQARAVTALWRVFKTYGARELIMNGPVNRAADLEPYRTALASTQLRAVRLTAERSALVARVRARLRGEMAPLAGDLLVGRTIADAEALAETALALQAETPADSSFPTLDTTELSTEESAQRVLASL